MQTRDTGSHLPEVSLNMVMTTKGSSEKQSTICFSDFNKSPEEWGGGIGTGTKKKWTQTIRSWINSKSPLEGTRKGLPIHSSPPNVLHQGERHSRSPGSVVQPALTENGTKQLRQQVLCKQKKKKKRCLKPDEGGKKTVVVSQR